MNGYVTLGYEHSGLSFYRYCFDHRAATGFAGNASLEQISRRVADKWVSDLTVGGPRVIRSMVDWDALRDTATKGVWLDPRNRLGKDPALVPRNPS